MIFPRDADVPSAGGAAWTGGWNSAKMGSIADVCGLAMDQSQFQFLIEEAFAALR
jgi:hypothetical protein